MEGSLEGLLVSRPSRTPDVLNNSSIVKESSAGAPSTGSPCSFPALLKVRRGYLHDVTSQGPQC